MTLREEYAQKQQKRESTSLIEAKKLLEQYFLIAEKLDTATISRIVDAMNSVETAIGPLLPKLKSLQTGLDAAESELTNLIAGKTGNDPKKTGVMLGKAMSFYQHLSMFLRQDLPVLMKSRMMADARSNPEQPIGPKLIPVFQQALAQEKTGGFLQRLFASTNIPYINNQQLATELASLTFQELEQLSKVGKVPAVATSAQIDQLAQAATGNTPAASQAPAAPATPPNTGTPAPTPGTPEGIPAGKQKEVEDYLKSAISGIMQGSPAAGQVAAQVAKKVGEILKT